MVNAITCGARTLDFSRPRIMGVLNVTPDSFSDGGQLYRDGRVDTDVLLARAEQMLAEGADILDVGGESTRPGAAAVGEAEELDRVVTAVEALAQHCDTIITGVCIGLRCALHVSHFKMSERRWSGGVARVSNFGTSSQKSFTY